MCHHCWEFDSVRTSGRKGRESVVAFPSRIGTLGLWRLAVGSGVLCGGLARKEANRGGNGRRAGRQGSRGIEIEMLADWAGLGRRERAVGLELGKLRLGQVGCGGCRESLTLPLGLRGWGPVAIEGDHRYP